MMEKVIIDAANAPLGRTSSYAAKQALRGNTVIVVNCNDALITGNKGTTIAEYTASRQRGKGNFRGPFFPKVSEKLAKRTIRGMLPHMQKRGVDALRRVRCYNETPKEYESAKKISMTKDLKVKTIKLSELAKAI